VRRWTPGVGAALLLAGCVGASADPGVDALLVVDGAQFVEGALGAPSEGPAITSVLNLTNSFRPGEVDRPLSGTLEPEASAVAIGLEGDRGYWVLVAGPPDVTLPDQPTFEAHLAFSHALGDEPVALVLSAVDAGARYGERRRLELASAGPARPDGELVVTLGWDRDADLDLRVVQPDGVELWSRNPNAAAPTRPGEPPSAAALAAGGAFGVDSNGRCVIDGVRQEHVVWAAPPPAGLFQVRVDTFSMCGQSSARWWVEVRRRGELIASAEGVSTELDTRFGHDLGAGLLALRFEER